MAAADARPPRAAPSGRIRHIAMDVADRAAVLRGLDEAEAAFGGPVDILVNAAGLYPATRSGNDGSGVGPRARHQREGHFLTSQEFCRRLVAAGRRAASSTSPRARRSGRALGAAHYCTSKAAAEMLTRCFALEFASAGIRVNAVSPGYVEVNSEVNPLSAAYKKTISGGIPLGRAGEGEDIAKAVCLPLLPGGGMGHRRLLAGGRRLPGGNAGAAAQPGVACWT